MSEYRKPTANETPILTRRAFLIGAGAVLALGLTGCADSKKDEALPQQEILTKLPEVKGTAFNGNPLERINTTYLSDLFVALQAEIRDKEIKVEAVQNSLRRIKNRTTGSEATVFQIDESGYYLTAKHAVPDKLIGNFVSVINPYNGEESLVSECKVHDKADIAVVYAPNGRPPRATDGLQFDFQGLQDEQRLWMVGLYANKEQELFRCIKYGRVDEAVELSSLMNEESTRHQVEQAARVAVRGMIPFGGTSGSPIVNNEGTIVGIEAGAFTEGAKTLEEYRGAVITPLSYAQALPSQPSLTI